MKHTTDTYDKTRRVNLGLTPEPTNVSYETGPPIFGLIAVYAFGMATGFGIAMLAFGIAMLAFAYGF